MLGQSARLRHPKGGYGLAKVSRASGVMIWGSPRTTKGIYPASPAQASKTPRTWLP